MADRWEQEACLKALLHVNTRPVPRVKPARRFRQHCHVAQRRSCRTLQPTVVTILGAEAKKGLGGSNKCNVKGYHRSE